jgi:hypothetical protein
MGIVIVTRITYSNKCTSGDGVQVLDVFKEPVSHLSVPTRIYELEYGI